MGADRNPPDNTHSLLALRASIDTVDTALVAILAQRFHLTEQVGRLKAQAGWAAADPDREAAQLDRYREMAAQHGVSTDVICTLMQQVVALAKARHDELRSEYAASTAHPDAGSFDPSE